MTVIRSSGYVLVSAFSLALPLRAQSTLLSGCGPRWYWDHARWQRRKLPPTTWRHRDHARWQ